MNKSCFAVALAFVVGACGGSDGTTTPTPVLTTLSVSVNPSQVQAGDQANATVIGKDQNGNVIAAGALNWSTQHSTVATVDQSGTVTGVAPGQTSVFASNGALSGNASITVAARPIATITATIANSSIEATKTTQATAVAKDASGNTLTGRSITWTTSSSAVVTVSASGVVTGMSAGNAEVIAQAEGKQGTVAITVTPQRVLATLSVSVVASSLTTGQQTAANAVARDQFGVAMTTPALAWTTGSAAVASVSVAGLVTANGPGQTFVRATSGAIQGSANITVSVPTTFGTGVKQVGVSVAPGTYRSVSPIGTDCYWERLSGFGGTFNELIANSLNDGPSVVTILPTDVGFSSNRCGTWSPATGAVTVSQTSPFGQGVWVVNVDVAPGTWRSGANVVNCYWMRMRNFTGDDEIIANDIVSGQAIVTISATDAGFTSNRCGTWTKIN